MTRSEIERGRRGERGAVEDEKPGGVVQVNFKRVGGCLRCGG